MISDYFYYINYVALTPVHLSLTRHSQSAMMSSSVCSAVSFSAQSLFPQQKKRKLIYSLTNLCDDSQMIYLKYFPVTFSSSGSSAA